MSDEATRDDGGIDPVDQIIADYLEAVDAGATPDPEALIARHAGLRVAGLSVVTNHAAGVGTEPLGHEQTMASARAAVGTVARLVAAFLPVVVSAPAGRAPGQRPQSRRGPLSRWVNLARL